jgi:hypothetical protein
MYGEPEAAEVCIQSRLVSISTDPPFRWDEAEADATKTLDLSPRCLKAHFRRGRARKELGKWDQARVGKDSGVVANVSGFKVDQVFRHSDVL